MIGFYHEQLGQVVESMYLKGEAKQAQHRAIAQYFAMQPLVNDAAPNLRKMAELPFQQTEGEQWNDLYETLTNFHFLEEKAKTGGTTRDVANRGTLTFYTGVYELQEDFDRALVKMPQE